MRESVSTLLRSLRSVFSQLVRVRPRSLCHRRKQQRPDGLPPVAHSLLQLPSSPHAPRYPSVLAVALGALFALPSPNAEAKPLVVVSVPPQEYFVAKLAGDTVEARALIPPGANPHVHEPSMRQVALLEKAAVYLVVGSPLLPLEAAWKKGAPKSLRVVDTARECDLAREHDAHLWVSPKCVLAMIEVMTSELEKLVPEESQQIRKNRDNFRQEVLGLEAELRKRLQPLSGKEFLVYHPAWGHFAEEFSIKQRAIEAEGKEPDARQLASIIREARTKEIKAIFVEPQFSKASAELVAREIGAKVVVVDSQAREWTENLRSFSLLLEQELR